MKDQVIPTSLREEEIEVVERSAEETAHGDLDAVELGAVYTSTADGPADSDVL